MNTQMMLNSLKPLVLMTTLSLCLSITAKAASSHHMVGISAGAGVPFPTQYSINYVHPSNKFSADINYNDISISVSNISVALKKTDLGLQWHPFAGSFYLGLNYGPQTLTAKSTDTISSIEVTSTVEVKSDTLTSHIGWMWGMADGGFFAGMDFGFESPSNAQTTLTTDADAAVQATPEYAALEADVQKQGKAFGETGFAVMTLLKIGYLF